MARNSEYDAEYERELAKLKAEAKARARAKQRLDEQQQRQQEVRRSERTKEKARRAARRKMEDIEGRGHWDLRWSNVWIGLVLLVVVIPGSIAILSSPEALKATGYILVLLVLAPINWVLSLILLPKDLLPGILGSIGVVINTIIFLSSCVYIPVLISKKRRAKERLEERKLEIEEENRKKQEEIRKSKLDSSGRAKLSKAEMNFIEMMGKKRKR